MTTVITDRALDANDRSQFRRITTPMRAELCAWLDAHDIDPSRTAVVGLDLIDCPLVRAELYRVDADGVTILDETGTQIVRDIVEVAQRIDLPAWWRPA